MLRCMFASREQEMGFGRWMFRKNYDSFSFPEDASWVDIAYEDMSAAQVKDHFKWYKEVSESRANYLMRFTSELRNEDLSLVPETLIAVWELVTRGINGIKVRPDKNGLSPLESSVGLGETYLKPDPFSFLLAFDLGHLFFALFKSNYPKQVEWSLGTKREREKNVPIVIGFDSPMVPERIAINCIRRHLGGNAEGDVLLKIYRTWEEHIIPGKP